MIGGLTQEKREEIISDFKRKTGTMLSSVYKQYGYDVFLPEVTSHITGLLEEAIKKVEEYYAK